MKVAIYDAHRYEREIFDQVNREWKYELHYFENRLTLETAGMAAGFPVVCAFVNDQLSEGVLSLLRAGGTRLIALRSAGFNHVDLQAAKRLDLPVTRVPAYSPHAVAEHAAALILALNRRICRAASRVRELNFSLEGLVGFDLCGKTVGVVGTGKIGSVMARIMRGFGCEVLAYDPVANPELVRDRVATYVSLGELYLRSDITSLHVPLTSATKHLVDALALTKMKPGVMLINTGRGALVDAHALVEGLKSGRVGAAGLDVYEEEEDVFFRDLSDRILLDDVLARLLTFPNVIVTSHQAFLTHEALTAIARTTLENIREFERGLPLTNEVRPPAAA